MIPQKAAYFKDRDAWEEGRLFFQKWLERHPDDAEARAHLGFFCVKESAYDTKRGLRELDRALRLSSGLAIAYVYKAIVLGGLLRHEDALVSLRKAEQCGALKQDLEWAAGCINLDAWRLDKAVLHFRRLAILSPTSSSLILLSQAYSQAGKQKQALLCANKAKEKEANDCRGWVYAGIYLAYLRRFDEARSQIKHALRLKRDCALAHHTLAYIENLDGNGKAAEKHLRDTLKIDPRYVTSRKMLADICARSGRIQEARKNYAASLRQFPDFKEARKSLEALRLDRKRRPSRSRTRR